MVVPLAPLRNWYPSRLYLVGINDAYIPPQSGAVSLGFATPAATVADLADQLVTYGKAVHPYLGVNIAQVTPQIAQSLDVKTTDGALVRNVTAGGPATAAGIAPGDVIVKLNHAPVQSV